MNKLPVTEVDPLSTLDAAMARWGQRADSIQSLVFHPVGRDHTLKLIKQFSSRT